VAGSSRRSVTVRTPSPATLVEAITGSGGMVAEGTDGALSVTGLTAAEIGDLAASAAVTLHELTPVASLEDAFMELTDASVEFRGGT